jgi:hypothetical protein
MYRIAIPGNHYGTTFNISSSKNSASFTKQTVLTTEGPTSSAGSVTFHQKNGATNTLMNKLMMLHGIVPTTPQSALPPLGGGIPRGE